ncbi:MAG: hypothetical protein AAFS10_04375 [Myxococcota bacterium]
MQFHIPRKPFDFEGDGQSFKRNIISQQVRSEPGRGVRLVQMPSTHHT